MKAGKACSEEKEEKNWWARKKKKATPLRLLTLENWTSRKP